MTDIASLGFSVDTSPLSAAQKNIQALVPAAANAETAAGNLEQQLVDTTTAATQAAAGVIKASTAVDVAAKGMLNAAKAVDKLAAANIASAAAADRAAAAMQRINASTGVNNKSDYASRAEDIAAYGAQLDNLRARFNPLAATMQNYRANVAAIRQANAVGAISVDEMTVALERERIAATQQIASFKNQGMVINDNIKVIHDHTSAMGLNRMQGLELAHVIRSLADSTAAGISPFRALTLEAGRIGEIFSGGGVLEGLKQTGVFLKLLRVVSVEAAAGETELAVATSAAGISAQMAAAAEAELAAAEGVATVGAEAATAAAGELAVANLAIGESAAGAAAGQEAAAGKMIVALAPLGVVLLVILGAIAVMAAGFAVGAANINASAGNIAKTMGLTTDEIDKLKKAHIALHVTMLDTLVAFFQVGWDRFKAVFGGGVNWLGKAWAAIMGFITMIGKGAIEGIIGGFVGAVYAIKAGWALLPAALGDAAYTAANLVIAATEFLINGAIKGINNITTLANEASRALGHGDIFTPIVSIQIERAKNPLAGKAADLGSAVAQGFMKGFKSVHAPLESFYNDVGARAIKDREDAIRKGLGKGHKPKKGPKTDAEKFDDIVTGVNGEIATENAKAAAAGIDLTTQAAIALEEKTKILNDVHSKGITLTDVMTKKVIDLSNAYAAAKVAADNAVGLKDVLKSGDSDIASLKAQADMIGVYGRQLEYATEMTKLLADAKSKGVTPDAIAAGMPQFQDKANAYADQASSNDTLKFMNDAKQAGDAHLNQLKQEQAQLGLSADATLRLKNENDLLNQALSQHIDLSASDIAALKGIADEQTAVEIATQRTQAAINFAKDATTGFIQDMRSGLQQGQNFWTTFGNAVMGVINKIIDKLIEMSVDNLFTSGGTGGGGGIGGFFGSLFKGVTSLLSGGLGGGGGLPVPTLVAQGGIFANSIVNKPTMFAHGGGLGIMGEAGPEAVMPLTRGPDGNLGVRQHGGSGGQVVSAPVTITNVYHLQGAISSADVQAMVRSGAEQSITHVRRNLMPWIAQYQVDGTVI